MFLELQINILIISGRIMTLNTRIMSAENSVTGINYILKYIKIEKKYLNILKHLNILNISNYTQLYCFYLKNSRCVVLKLLFSVLPHNFQEYSVTASI